MRETKNRYCSLSSVYSITPQSPIYSIMDTWTANTITTKQWDYTIPNDGMVYTICDFCHACLPAVYVYGGIGIDGNFVHRYYTGYSNYHIWDKENPFVLRHPQVISVQLANIYEFDISHYWCLSFYRKPA